MKILFAYRGKPSPAYIPDTTPEHAIKLLPTTHMSAVNGLLVPYYLQQLGHDVTFLTDREPEPWWFPQVHVGDADPADFDCLYLWKLHAVRDWLEQYPHLIKQKWRHVAAWFDFPGVRGHVRGAHMIDSFAWGTDVIGGVEAPTFPRAKHCVVEHATVFTEPPEMGETEPCGLFAGRLPVPYLRALEAAAAVVPMKVYALWVAGEPDRVLLRPGQYDGAELALARRLMPDNVTLHPGANMLEVAREASAASFGLVPSTQPPGKKQLLSACKAWDYWAMGLPVVISGNVPEMRHLADLNGLGGVYDRLEQVGDAIKYTDGIKLLWTDTRKRQQIQDWIFAHHTWRHRAAQIHEEQLCTLV